MGVASLDGRIPFKLKGFGTKQMTTESSVQFDTRCDKRPTELRVTVTTKSLIFPLDPPRVKTINWFNSSDRIWFKDHQTWAMHNQHSILIQPIV